MRSHRGKTQLSSQATTRLPHPPTKFTTTLPLLADFGSLPAASLPAPVLGSDPKPTVSSCRGDLSAKAKLGRSCEKTFCSLHECLHVRRLKMRTCERLFAIPLLDEQQPVWIV